MKKGIFAIAIFYALILMTDANALSVNLQAARGFTTAEKTKLNVSLALVEKVMNSTEFRDQVLNFKNLNGKTEYHQNEGMTNEQIYNLLMGAGEKYPVQTAADQIMDYELQIYSPRWYQSKKVIGYTDQSYMTIFMNRRFYRNFVPSDIVGNLVHEWIHKMGFGHDFYYSTQRDYSVPYAIGYIAENIAKKLSQ